MAGEGWGIAEYDKFHAGPGDSDIHATQVIEKPDVAVFVGTDEADENDISFLTLETVDGVNGNKAFQGMKEAVVLDELADVLHLHPVWRD